MDLLRELFAIAGALEDAALPFALAGGWALAIHGSPRATTDIDLLLPETALQRALTVVSALGFHEPRTRSFGDGMEIVRVTKIASGAALTLDLLVARAPLDAALASRERLALAEGALWVISRDALIAMKLWSGRPQDLVDVARLTGDDR